MSTVEHDDALRGQVRETYGAIARDDAACGCGPACCTPQALPVADVLARRHRLQRGGTPERPGRRQPGPGLRQPAGHRRAEVGETVLDRGSGAGFDVFLAANAVGPAGRVIGVDMTPDMLGKARANAAKGGYANVEFRLGEIEHLPVADASVDVILSTCVINLSPDKPQVFREAFRVLRPGGRLAVSDVVLTAELPASMRDDLALYTGCVAGAAGVAELTEWLAAAGFSGIRITPQDASREFLRHWAPGRGVEDYIASASIEAVKPQSSQESP